MIELAQGATIDAGTIREFGAIAVFLLAGIALVRGTFVTGSHHAEVVGQLNGRVAEMVADRDFWRDAYLAESDIARRGLTIAERTSGPSND